MFQKQEENSFFLYFRNAALISILRGINHKLKTIKIETEKAEKGRDRLETKNKGNK